MGPDCNGLQPIHWAPPESVGPTKYVKSCTGSRGSTRECVDKTTRKSRRPPTPGKSRPKSPQGKSVGPRIWVTRCQCRNALGPHPHPESTMVPRASKAPERKALQSRGPTENHVGPVTWAPTGKLRRWPPPGNRRPRPHPSTGPQDPWAPRVGPHRRSCGVGEITWAPTQAPTSRRLRASRVRLKCGPHRRLPGVDLPSP